MLLLAERRISPRLCHIARGLLQLCFVFRAEEGHGQLQHVQNAAARLVTGTWKSERGLSRLMH